MAYTVLFADAMYFPYDLAPYRALFFWTSVTRYNESLVLYAGDDNDVAYVLLHNVDKFDPNVHLSGFGGVLRCIPGDAVLLKEIKGMPTDIDADILEKLPAIVQKDKQQRKEFRKALMRQCFGIEGSSDESDE